MKNTTACPAPIRLCRIRTRSVHPIPEKFRNFHTQKIKNMEQHANSSDGASDPTNPSTSQLRRSGYIIGVIALVIVILTAATRPLSNTQWWLIFVAFVILISVAAIVLHRYEMIEYRAKELKIKMHLDVQFLAQGQILEQ